MATAGPRTSSIQDLVLSIGTASDPLVKPECAAYRFSGPLSAHLAAGRLMCADHRHLASVINHTLAAIDELTVSPGEAVRGEDVLKMMAVSLEPSGDSQRPG